MIIYDHPFASSRAHAAREHWDDLKNMEEEEERHKNQQFGPAGSLVRDDPNQSVFKTKEEKDKY